MSFQKVVGHIGLRAQRQPGYEGPVPQFLTREALVLQGIVEIRRGAGVLACVRAEGAVGGVELAGFDLQAVADLAALVQEIYCLKGGDSMSKGHCGYAHLVANDDKHYVLGTMFYRYISENLTAYINEGEHQAG